MTYKSQRWNFTPPIKKWYELHFGCTVSDQVKHWAPHICYVTCVRLLTGWVNDLCQMFFAIPTVRRQPKDNSSDCYFCFTNMTGITSKSKHTVKYPDLQSAMRPFPHSEGLSVPSPLQNLNFSDDNSDSNDHGQQEWDNVECIPTLEVVPHLNPIYWQQILKMSVTWICLKNKPNSRVKGWNLLH